MKLPVMLVVIGIVVCVGRVVMMKSEKWGMNPTVNSPNNRARSGSELQRKETDVHSLHRSPSKSGLRTRNHVDVIGLMQASVGSGAIREFKFEDVIEWNILLPEDVDGTRYNIGEVVYPAETIFGVKNLRVKAYIRDNQIERWVFPLSGLEVD